MAGLTGNFKRNIAALSSHHTGLAERLKNIDPGSGDYTTATARTGAPVPVYGGRTAEVHLNSAYDPDKEARRFADRIDPASSYLCLGLEGGYVQRALLNRKVELVLIIDFDFRYLRFLLEHFDLVDLLLDPRLRIIIGESAHEAAAFVLDRYLPLFHGNLSVISWRPRERTNEIFFEKVRGLLPEVIRNAAIDLSTQKKFGYRWMHNIVTNAAIAAARAAASYAEFASRGYRKVHVTAAGPSLETSLPVLSTLPPEECIVATDTSLPLLVACGIFPQFVVSVDCQFYSFYHFLSGIPAGSCLVLDLASPPKLFRLPNPVIPVAGGHPFVSYISSHFVELVQVDTSGGNVTHAAVSFADCLETEEIVLHGADFCYPEGKLYARGTYLYSYFDTRARRTAGLETLCARMLLDRGDLIVRENKGVTVTYGTGLLESYREKLNRLAGGLGRPLTVAGRAEFPRPRRTNGGVPALRKKQHPVAKENWPDFCVKLLEDLKGIPVASDGIQTLLAGLSSPKRQLLYGLMPLAASFLEKDSYTRGADLLRDAVSEVRGMIAHSLAT